MTFVPTAEDFTLKYDNTHTFSFFESEDGYIFSYDHADPQKIVSEVREYDKVTTQEYYTDEEYEDLISYVRHTWAIIVAGENNASDWRFSYGESYRDEENSFPLTIITR